MSSILSSSVDSICVGSSREEFEDVSTTTGCATSLWICFPSSSPTRVELELLDSKRTDAEFSVDTEILELALVVDTRFGGGWPLCRPTRAKNSGGR